MKKSNYNKKSLRQAPGSFMEGARLPLAGAKFLWRRPKLWILVLIPLIVNILLFGALITWGYSELAGLLDSWLQGLEGWYWTALRWLGRFFFGLVILIIVYFIFTPVALLIAAPFNDRLAEHVEIAFGFQIEDQRSLIKMILMEAAFAIMSEAKRLIVVLAVFAVLLLLNLIPVAGSAIYACCAFCTACWFFALEFSSYAADRRHLGMRQKLRLLRENNSLSAGFGLVTALLMMVPFLNVLMVPVSAVSGTMLFGRLSRKLK
jgi:CysZ protein